jgi:hypothetical protein
MACLEKEGLVSIKKLRVNTCTPMADSLLTLCEINSVNRPLCAFLRLAEEKLYTRLVKL